MSRPADLRTERVVVWAIVALVVVARSAVLVFWEQASFDSDQAVIGLMAKHLSEGRAFPLFLYGQNYVLAVEAWTAAPIFLIAGVSVATLKLPLLAINIVVALLLLHLLEREAGLRPRLAAVAALFFVLPPPGTAAELLNAAGTNIEPFLYILLIWVARRRPGWCGLIAGVGFLQREFTLYGPIALLVIGAGSGALFTRDGVRRVIAAARVFVEVWLVVALLKTVSSPAGPGTTIADVPSSNNVRNLLERICFDPGGIVGGASALVRDHLVPLFGLRVQPLLEVFIDSRVEQGVPGTGAILAFAMLLAIARVLASVATIRSVPRQHYFAAYLTLVGVITGAAFVLARCGRGTTGYTLLSIFAALGIAAWYLQVEQDRRLKALWIGLVAAWALVAAVGHGRLWTEYLRNPPVGYKRLIIGHLQQRGVRYGMTDYWNAYYISFLTNEQVIMQSTDYDRIREYDRVVEAHKDEAVRVLRMPCQTPGGERILQGIYLCPPEP